MDGWFGTRYVGKCRSSAQRAGRVGATAAKREPQCYRGISSTLKRGGISTETEPSSLFLLTMYVGWDRGMERFEIEGGLVKWRGN